MGTYMDVYISYIYNTHHKKAHIPPLFRCRITHMDAHMHVYINNKELCNTNTNTRTYPHYYVIVSIIWMHKSMYTCIINNCAIQIHTSISSYGCVYIINKRAKYRYQHTYISTNAYTINKRAKYRHQHTYIS